MKKDRKVFFLSHIINEQMPIYGGRKSISLKKTKAIAEGATCNEMYFSFSNHIGTHVDVPLHFVKRGHSITDFIAEDWVFSKISLTKISNIEPGYIIRAEDVEEIKDCELLLIKTGFEKHRQEEVYWKNSPALHPGFAYWLRKKCPSIRAIGIDFISISNLSNRVLGREAHKAFLRNNILLIEDMKLSILKDTPDRIIVAPLLVEKADGSPCTIFAINN